MIALALLVVLTLVDMAWLAQHPPPGQATNPYNSYLLVYTLGVGALSVALRNAARRWGERHGRVRLYVLLGCGLAILEEVIAFLTHSGLYQDNRHPLGEGLVQAGIPLATWTLALLVPLRRYRYDLNAIVLVTGFSGWFCEAVIGGLMRKEAQIAIIILPSVMLSYVFLMFLPYHVLEHGAGSSLRSRWRHPAAFVSTVLGWVAGGILGAVLLH